MGIPILTALTSTHITNTTTHSFSYSLEKNVTMTSPNLHKIAFGRHKRGIEAVFNI